MNEEGSLSVPSCAQGGKLSYAIFTLARAHRGYAAELLRELGLHPGQELLLMQLLDRDGQTQSELLDSVGLDHSTVSKSLGRMEEARADFHAAARLTANRRERDLLIRRASACITHSRATEDRQAESGKAW